MRRRPDRGVLRPPPVPAARRRPGPAAPAGSATSAAGHVAHHLDLAGTAARRRSRSVLVAGCGTSQAVRHALRHPAATVVGIDVSAAQPGAHPRPRRPPRRRQPRRCTGCAIEDVGELGRAVRPRRVHRRAAPPRAIRLTGLRRAARRPRTAGRDHVDGVRPLRPRRRLPCSRTTAAGSASARSATDARRPRRDAARAAARSSASVGCCARPATSPTTTRSPTPCATRATAPTPSPSCSTCSRAPGCGSGAGSARRPTCPDCGVDQRDAARGADRRAARPGAVRARWSCSVARSPATRRSPSTPTTPSSGALDFADATPSTAGCPSGADRRSRSRNGCRAGAAAALINRAHTDTDLVLFVDQRQLEVFRSIDGRRTDRPSSEPAPPPFVERLWRHDLVVCDTTAAGIHRDITGPRRRRPRRR